MTLIFTGLGTRNIGEQVYRYDENSQPVLVENFTKTTWEVGKSYRIYGDAYGTYNGMPWLAARYTY